MKKAVPEGYDFLLSTEDNYSTDITEYVGEFAEFRRLVDRDYHKQYTPERQLVQDGIMLGFTATIVEDVSTLEMGEIPDRNWLVFTAGAMGAGKTHTLQWLNNNRIFPLASFVRVDPDALRELLPEYDEYIMRDKDSMGKLTQKEVGYLSELLTLHSLKEGKNVLIDGSLRNAEWHKSYISSVQDEYPTIRTAILHVIASEETVMARCLRRASPADTCPRTLSWP